jgi:hypothetical protein
MTCWLSLSVVPVSTVSYTVYISASRLLVCTTTACVRESANAVVAHDRNTGNFSFSASCYKLHHIYVNKTRKELRTYCFLSFCHSASTSFWSWSAHKSRENDGCELWEQEEESGNGKVHEGKNHQRTERGRGPNVRHNEVIRFHQVYAKEARNSHRKANILQRWAVDVLVRKSSRFGKISIAVTLHTRSSHKSGAR